jgi:hypothetical protein
MQVLLDPNFEYPDLVAVAEAMVAGTISTEEACALARKVTGGEIRQTSVGRALVIGPQSRAEKVLKDIQAFAHTHNQSSAERWAAFALMIEAQLGIGDLDPEGAPIGLENALGAFMPAVKATGARCPPEAVEYAVWMVDSILQNPACTDPDLRAYLTKARASFSEGANNYEASAKTSTHTSGGLEYIKRLAARWFRGLRRR